MIEKLPIDLFGEPEPAAEPEHTGAAPSAILCAWCAAEVPDGERHCPACGAFARPVTTAPPPAALTVTGDGLSATVCQWCGVALAPEDETCSACGWDARGENAEAIPGLTVPHSETQIRAIYGGDEQDDVDPAIEIIAALVVGLLPPD